MALAATPAGAVVNLTRLTGATTALSQLNAIVFTNMTAQSDVEGKLWVGGNFTGSIAVGNGNAKYGAATSAHTTVTIGGTLSGTLNINNGKNGTSGTVATGAYGIRVNGASDNAIVNLNDQNTAAKVAMRGNAGQLSVGSNSTVNIGGNVTSTLSLGSGSSARIGGNLAGLNASNGATNTYVGGDVQGPNGNQPTMNLGSNGNLYIAKQFKAQSYNGVSGKIYINGYDKNGKCVDTGNYDFCAGKTITAPDLSSLNSIASTTAEMQKSLSYLSKGISTLPAIKQMASIATLSLSDYGNKTYSVFKVTNAATFFGQNSDLDSLLKNMPTGKTVIFNVAGTTIDDWANFNGNDKAGLFASNIIWNFYEATSVTLNRQFFGTVLAPLATVSNPNTPINGSVVAQLFNQKGEVHLGTFAGPTNFLVDIKLDDPYGPSPAPEPATWATMLIGFGAMGFAIRRRRKALAAS